VVRTFGFWFGDVDADFPHGLDRGGVDLVAGEGTGGADLDPPAREVAEESGGHLRPAGVVHADEQHGGERAGGHRFFLRRIKSP
jgi:hypothetical protein